MVIRKLAYIDVSFISYRCHGRHVSDILADEMTGGKVLVFAHHRNVLDALEEAVVRTGRVEYIRIDGRTKVGSCAGVISRVFVRWLPLGGRCFDVPTCEMLIFYLAEGLWFYSSRP